MVTLTSSLAGSVHLAHIADDAVGDDRIDALGLGGGREQFAPESGALLAIGALQKQLMKKVDVNHIEVPFYDELSVKALWPEIKRDPEFTQYFPDTYPAGKGPPRQYFFDILNTLQPNISFTCIQWSHSYMNSSIRQADRKTSQSRRTHRLWQRRWLHTAPQPRCANAFRAAAC